MILISLSHSKKMAERDPDYLWTHFMEKLHLVSNSDSIVAVTPAEDTNGLLKCFESTGKMFCLSSLEV